MTTFKEVAHLYVGCKVMDLRPESKGMILTLSGGGLSLVSQFNWNFIFKPIFFRLEDMTREELSKLPSPDIFRKGEVVTTAETFLYILKNHFDLFGLIDAGEAIDAKTLDTNPYK